METINRFEPRWPQDDDYILCYSGNSLLLAAVGEEMDFPTAEALLSRQADITDWLVYAFTVEDRACFILLDYPVREGREWRYQPVLALRSLLPGWRGFAGLVGQQLQRWLQANRYCGRCGQPLQLSDTERALHCGNCDLTIYPKIVPVVILALLDGQDRLLLTRFAQGSYHEYALISGFVEIGETLEEAAQRELLEETGLRLKDIRYYGSTPWPVGDSILMGFFARLDGDAQITLDTSELAEACWLSREKMEPSDPARSLTHAMMEAFRTGII